MQEKIMYFNELCLPHCVIFIYKKNPKKKQHMDCGVIEPLLPYQAW